MNKELDKLKSDYENLSEKPSLDLWSQLEEKLDKKELDKKVIYPKWWLAVASIVLLGGLAFLFLNQEEEVHPMVKQNSITESKSNVETEIKETLVVCSKNESKEVLNLPIQNGEEELVINNIISDNSKAKVDKSVKSTISKVEKPKLVQLVNNRKSDTMENIAKRNNSEEYQDYISADDLLFERALHEADQENTNSIMSKLGKNIQTSVKLHSVEILGVEVYHSEKK